MHSALQQSEFVVTSWGIEQCSECGHRWVDDGPVHRPDCRYAFVEELEEDDNELLFS